MSKIYKNILIVIAGFLVIPVDILLSGLTLSLIWKWFVVVKFNAPPLTIIQAYYLCVMVSFFTYSHTTKDERSITDKIVYAILKPAMYLFTAFLLSFFLF